MINFLRTNRADEKISSDWHDILSASIVTAAQLAKFLPVEESEVLKVTRRYPMRINPYYLSLISQKGDPIWKQAIPDIKEIRDSSDLDDPLSEEAQSPIPNLTHRYPDRVLFMVSNQCAMYCRHCMRKRKVGHPLVISDATIREGIKYIRQQKSIRNVIISGGDPLLLEDEALNIILERLYSISHLEIICIHTRVPCTLPQRVTKELAAMLKKFHPIFLNTHFNHPAEITPEAAKACTILADAGIPLGCQTVLLKGVNDNPAVMKLLMQNLLKIRVKPYYIHHPDPVKGTGHFRTSISNGLEIMKKLRGYVSGLGVPHYMIDLPGGGGKVPLLPEYVKGTYNGKLKVVNYKGDIFEYTEK